MYTMAGASYSSAWGQEYILAPPPLPHPQPHKTAVGHLLLFLALPQKCSRTSLAHPYCLFLNCVTIAVRTFVNNIFSACITFSL